MRTEKSLKNVSVGFINNFLLLILRFVSRTIFIRAIGELYLGVNGLLSNVLGILALADLGIGSAISYALYKPLQEKDTEKIKTYMHFYKRVYQVISLVVFILGLILLNYLDFFIKDNQGISNLNIYYLLFLANMIFGYLFSYKRTLIIADQNEYKITLITMVFNFILTISQILMIIIFKSYFLYLVVQTISILMEHIFINKFINKKYPYILEKNIKPLEKKEKQDLKIKIKALLFHKFGSFFVDSTDNIIISKYLGLITVGMYSNYYLITSMINRFINTGIWGMASSIGNLVVIEESEKKYKVYKTINFLGFSVLTICSVCLLNLLNPFIAKLWGGKLIFGFATVLIIVANFYVSGLMHINDTVKSTAGLFTKDKYVPLIQSFVNIAVSLLLVKKFGITGVFIGTIISSIIPTIIKPIIIYKYLFKRSSVDYFKDYIKQAIILIMSIFISLLIVKKIPINNFYLSFLFTAIISVLIPLTIIIIFYFKSCELKDVKERFLFLKNKRKK